jgi:probable F420-dependent oxidoreductase
MSTRENPRLGRIGVWSLELRYGNHIEAAEAAAEVDELGYGAIWVPGGVGGDITGDLDRLLEATKQVTVASGILNIWKHEPQEIGRWWNSLPADRRSRVLLGLGVSHQHSIGEAYRKPLQAMRDYLDALAEAGMPAQSLCLAALGPKMLELAGERTAGVHPYLVTPEHSATARHALGPGKVVAPEQGVVLESDPARARALGRKALVQYQNYPNYRNSWGRLGFTDEEIDGASDRLVDALFAWGDVEQIGARVNAHLAAGADHVCLQAITGAGLDIGAARAAWRQLAGLLAHD